MEILLAVILFVVGAVMGSFACCQAWRVHLKETKTKKQLASSKWSACLSCGERLKWYDNIPVLSWVILRGKCRKCKKKIGLGEILSEVILGILFVVFGLSFWWGFDPTMIGGEAVRYWVMAALVMVLLIGFTILFVSDAKWGRLPVVPLIFCIICAIMYAITREWDLFTVDKIWNYVGALLVLPVLYYLLYKISRERWVGSGDWMVALPIALVLGNFWLSFLCVFVSNFVGCLVMVPVMKIKKKNTNMQIPFGPFLIAGFIMVFLMQDWLLGLASF